MWRGIVEMGNEAGSARKGALRTAGALDDQKAHEAGNSHAHQTFASILASLSGDASKFDVERAIEDAMREREAALGPRKNPLHPMFRDHNCYRCKDGEKPCVHGNPHGCEYPHARND